MALVTDREAPDDIPTTNALATLEDPDNPTPERDRAEIYLSGAHVATVDKAPLGRERITMMVELEVIEESVRFNENDTEIPIRRCRRVGDMWPVGTARPKQPEKKKTKAELDAEAEAAAAENQPELFGDLAAEEFSDDPDAEADDLDDVEAPEFSDGAE